MKTSLLIWGGVVGAITALCALFTFLNLSNGGDLFLVFFGMFFGGVTALPAGIFLGVAYGLGLNFWLSKTSWPRRHINGMIVAAYGLPLAISIVAALIAGRMGDEPTSRDLARRFRDNRARFDAIERFARQDHGPGFSEYGTDAQLVERGVGRLNDYLRLINAVGLHQGLSLHDDRSLLIPAYAQGCVPCTDIEKGFAFSEKPPSPLVADLDAAIPLHQEKRFTLYQPLTGNWYLYYELVD